MAKTELRQTGMRRILSTIGLNYRMAFVPTASAVVLACLWFALPASPRFVWTLCPGVQPVGFSPDGQILVTKDGPPALFSKAPRLWNVATGVELARLEDPCNGRLAIQSFGFEISANNRWAAFNAGPLIYVFDVTTGKEVFRGDIVWKAFGFARTGDLLVCEVDKGCSRGILCWDLSREEEVCFLPDQHGPLRISNDGVRLAAFDPANEELTVWKLFDGSRECKFNNVKKKPWFTAFSLDQRTMLAIDVENWFEREYTAKGNHYRLTLFDLRTGERRTIDRWENLYGIQPGLPSRGPILYESNYTSKSPWVCRARMIEPFSWRECGSLTIESRPEYLVEWPSFSHRVPLAYRTKEQFDFPRLHVSPDGRVLLRPGHKNRSTPWPLCLLPRWMPGSDWSIPHYYTLTWFDTATGEQICNLKGNCLDPLFSPDGQTLVARGDDQCSLYFWDVPPRKPLGWYILGSAILIIVAIAIQELLRDAVGGSKAAPT
jgi:hypothetical protein